MFNFTDNGSHTGSGPAVEDEIVRDTGRALGQVMAAARSWIHNHRGRRGAEGVPKLTRKERRDLAEAIRVQVGEQKIAAAWFTKRVNDYHAEVVAAGLRRQQPGFTERDAELDRERLAGIRYSIESTLHEGQALPLERRGQVALALSAADTNPSQPYGAIFKTMNAEQARTARAVAVQSEAWVESRREHNARLVAEQRARAAQLAEARRELRPPRHHDDLDSAQREAVQQLRSAHLGVDRDGSPLPGERDVELAQARSVRIARESGLTRREIGEELDYLAENTGYTATYGGEGGHQVVNHYPHRAVAISELKRSVSQDPRLPEENVFADVEARRDGYEAQRDVEKRGVFGARHEVAAAVARWDRDPAQLPEYVGERTEVAVARIEPGTGKVLSSEVATLASEQAAVDYAHRVTSSAGTEVARMRVEITDPTRPESPRYSDYGLPRTLTDSLSDLRVSSRERLLDGAEKAVQNRDEELSSLRQRHGLSIEHNADLTERNARLTQQLTAMIAERDQAVAATTTLRAEIDAEVITSTKLRQERDEAVAKLVATTRPSQRYGSAERQAAQSRGDKEMDEIVGDRSPALERESAMPEFSGVASGSGNALADALERQAERDGMER